MRKTTKRLAKIAGVWVASEFVLDVGKALMFRALKESSPEAADKLMSSMEAVDAYSKELGLMRATRVKVVRGLCKFYSQF